MNEAIVGWGLLIIASIFNSYASLIVKLRFNELGNIDFSSLRSVFNYLVKFLKSPLLMSAIVTFMLAPIALLIALNRIDLSVAFPVQLSLHLFWIVLFSVLFLGEKIDRLKIIGVICILLSVLLLYKS